MGSGSQARSARGAFITFEGIEGSGKSLQIQRVSEYLRGRGISCLITREPGGTELGVALREVLLRRGGPPPVPWAELLLYLADRCQHLEEIIRPALERGETVLSDRFHDATRVYQGLARGLSPERIETLTDTLQIPEPDLTLLLDLEPVVAITRARSRDEARTQPVDEGRFEAEDLSFHRAVRAGYLTLAGKASERITIVDASGTAEAVFGRIRLILEHFYRSRV